MTTRFVRLAAILLILGAAPAWGQDAATTDTPKDPFTPPKMDLQLIRVGGSPANGIVEYFDETSVVRAEGTASVWRVYVLTRPRRLGRLVTQAVWALSDFDCNSHTVEPRSTAILGISLEPIAHGRRTLADDLFTGELASALVARQVCDNRKLDGERFPNLPAAVRDARAGITN